MNKAGIKRAFEELDRREGVSVETVRHEIEIVIDAARRSTDPAAQKFWSSFPCADRAPTPEEVIMRLNDEMKG